MIRLMALILGGILFLGSALPVAAAGPVLELVAQGRSLEGAGGWTNEAFAKPGDTFLLWFVVKNTTDGTVANNSKIKVDIPSGEANPLVITVHAVADNASEVTKKITINLSGSASVITYYPDETAEFITNGVKTKILPNSETANMTTQYVNIGNIKGGYYSYAKVLGTTKIAPRETPVPTATITPTTTPTVAGTSVAATSSAVAKTTPDTGINEVLWPSLGWFTIGLSGYSIRKWAKQKSK